MVRGRQRQRRPNVRADLPQPVCKKPQRPRRSRPRVELAQAACSGIARVDEHLFAGGSLPLVQLLEVAMEKQCLTAYLKQRRRIGTQP